MATVTVTLILSAESAAFMHKCIGNAEGPERDAFFETAIAALAEALLVLDEDAPLGDGHLREH